jgi:hypothetical protein
MSKKFTSKNVLTTLLVTVTTVPCTAFALDVKSPEEVPVSKTGEVHNALATEVIQLIKDEGQEGKFKFNIAGNIGVNFRIYYGLIDEQEKYRLLPGAEGAIGENGMATIPLDLNGLGDNIYLKVFTSNNTDFSGEVRVTANPIVVSSENEEEQLELRGVYKDTLKKIGDEIEKRLPGPKVKTPTAVAAVRGYLPEVPREDPL